MKKTILISVFSLMIIFLVGFIFWKINQNQTVVLDIDNIKKEEPQLVKNFVYQNSTHDFVLTLPESWRSFDVSEHTYDGYDDICFSFKQPQPFCIFSIIKLNNIQWEKLELKQEKNIILKSNDSVYLCDGCCRQGDDTTAGGQFNDFQAKRCGEVPGIIKTFKILNSQVSDWKIYNTPDKFISFNYPLNLEKIVSSKQFNLSVNSIQNITDEYAKYKDGGCPSTCGQLAADPILFQKQFDILRKMNSLPNCTLTPKDKQEINDKFILFSGGISSKYQIEGIKTKLGQCGLKIIQSDGFDVSLSNIHYKVSLFVDNKIINISFPLYPHGVFASVDDLWKNIGFDSTTSICGSSCLNKELDYYNKFNINNDTEKEVIKIYDQIVATLKFTNQYQQN
ncbi:MAG: hypothetical protein WC894_06185 [Patescibacteria group bacterium]